MYYHVHLICRGLISGKSRVMSLVEELLSIFEHIKKGKKEHSSVSCYVLQVIRVRLMSTVIVNMRTEKHV